MSNSTGNMGWVPIIAAAIIGACATVYAAVLMGNSEPTATVIVVTSEPRVSTVESQGRIRVSPTDMVDVSRTELPTPRPFRSFAGSVKATEQPVSPTDPPDDPQYAPPPTTSSQPVTGGFKDTVPGSILGVGQTWRQNGMTLQVPWNQLSTAPEFTGVSTKGLLLANKTDTTIIVSLGADSFRAYDNLGNQFKVTVGCPCNTVTYDAIGDRSEPLAAGATAEYFRNNNYLMIWADILNPQVTDVFLEVSLSRIQNATWRIPIVH